jgi:hypothetical protein
LPQANVCRTDTAAVEARDVAYVLGALQTRIYDPVGNLRKADDQTTVRSRTRDKPASETPVWCAVQLPRPSARCSAMIDKMRTETESRPIEPANTVILSEERSLGEGDRYSSGSPAKRNPLK